MQNEDQYLERTPNLVDRVRSLREAAEREMNRFTNTSDYDARCLVGRGPQPATAPETVTSPFKSDRPKSRAAKATSAQAALDSAPAPAMQSNPGEEA